VAAWGLVKDGFWLLLLLLWLDFGGDPAQTEAFARYFVPGDDAPDQSPARDD